MAEIVLQETSLCFTLFIDLCNKNCRKDKGLWEQAIGLFLSSAEPLEDDNLLEDEFADDVFLGGEEMDVKQIESIRPDENYSGRFFIVSNTGCLFGDYDHKQRL